MDIVFPILAFFSVLGATSRSLGWGFTAVLAFGYFNGVIRANFIGVYTTFMFDFALVGLYVGFYFRHDSEFRGIWERTSGLWVLALIGWPFFLTLLPMNDYLVQLVALRGTVFFLPTLLVATRLTLADLSILTRTLAVLNLCSLVVAVLLYYFGVETLFPQNQITQIIYMSRDVSGGYHRIPSTFLSAHAYGGTMLWSLFLLLDRVFGPNVTKMDRTLAAMGVVAAAAGILMCAARSPVVLVALTTLIAWSCTRFNLAVGVVATGLILGGFVLALTNERFQRSFTLEDTEFVSDRIRISANESFLVLATQYPIGAGMGSSAGTSIPYFLAERAPVAIGMENEYCRILIDQGWFGLGLWLGFLIWLFASPPKASVDCTWTIAMIIAYSLCLATWLTGFIGTGALSAIPGTVLMLVQMGLLARIRDQSEEGP